MNIEATLQDRLAGLVARPSVSSLDPARNQDPRPCLESFADRLDRAGGRVELLENQRRPGHPVLVADFGPTAAAPALMLAGHLDTVPAKADDWSGDPWNLRKVEHRWLGLGVSDMKGFFAAAEYVLAQLGSALDKQVRLVATSDEESGMEGARELADRNELWDVPTVLGEPTGGQVAYGCKGVSVLAVTFAGVDGHASRLPLPGVAADTLRGFLNGLDRWQEDVKTTWHDDLYRPPFPTVNVGRIEGGDAFNRIATPFEVDLELRLVPAFGPEAALEAVTAIAHEAAAEHGTRATVVERFAIPPFLGETAREEKVAMSYTTEAGFFPGGGQHVRIWGPGEVGEAHTADEAIDIADLVSYTRALEQFVAERCVR